MEFVGFLVGVDDETNCELGVGCGVMACVVPFVEISYDNVFVDSGNVEACGLLGDLSMDALIEVVDVVEGVCFHEFDFP